MSHSNRAASPPSRVVTAAVLIAGGLIMLGLYLATGSRAPLVLCPALTVWGVMRTWRAEEARRRGAREP